MWLAAALALIAVGLSGWALPPFPPPPIAGTAVRVLDPITVEVRIAHAPTPAPTGLAVGAVVPVRYLGLSVAEAARGPARALHAALVEGRALYLELDAQEKDAEGNLLVYAYLDPEGRLMVNVALLTTGLFSLVPSPGLRYAGVLAHAAAIPTPTVGCPSPVLWTEARGQIGNTLCVEGPVASVGTSRGGDVFLNVGRPYPDPGRFTLYIPARHVGKFEAAFGSGFWTRLIGRTVQATGEVRLYQGGPEIILTDPSSLFLKP